MVDSAGNLFIVDTINQVIRKVSGGIISTVAGTPGAMGSTGDGGPPLQAQFNNPFAITLDPSGNLYVGDTRNNRVRKISGLASVAAPCTYSLDSGGQAFPPAGGSGSVTITTSRVAIGPSPALRVGSRLLQRAAAAERSPIKWRPTGGRARTATFTVAESSFTSSSRRPRSPA